MRWMVGGCVLVLLLALPGTAVAGLNGDGNTDVIFASANGLSGDGVCLGDASGGFVCSKLAVGETGARDVVVGHLDDDANLDLVFGTPAGPDRVCLGDGSGGFACGDMSMLDTDTSQFALGDVNNDGNADVVAANNGRDQVCLGDGTGSFACVDVSSDDMATGGVALGDVNGDGDLDAVFANYGSAFTGARNTVCLGGGTGAFSCSDVSSISDSSLDVQLGDVNHDGDVDAVFSSHQNNSYEHSTVCLGDGSGGFACQPLDSIFATRLALGDVNGDDHLDAVIAHDNGRNRVCLGDGTGEFGCNDVSTDTNSTWDVGLVDVDRDGHLDAVFANLGPEGQGQRDRVCLGDGTGLFSCSDVSPDVTESHGLAFAPGHRGTFIDDDFSIFELDIEWLVEQGITQGCTVDGTLYCPDDNVTRGQMAAFLARAFNLPDAGSSPFSDTTGSIFEADIAKVAAAGITQGCTADGTMFCPDGLVTRGQMAAFLSRALVLPEGAVNTFVDDDGSIFEADIAKIAEAGITQGCTADGTMFCPNDFVTRGQMAAFVHRGLGT